MNQKYPGYEFEMKLKSMKQIRNNESLQRIYSDQSPTFKRSNRKRLYTLQCQQFLQTVVKKLRVNSIVNRFIYKLRRNIARNNPVDYDIIQDKITQKKKEQQSVRSFKLNEHLKASLISLDIICILVIQTLSTFHGFYEDYIETDSSSLPIILIEIFCLIVFFLKLFIGFTTPRLSHGKNIQYMHIVAKEYVMSIIFVFNLFNFVMTVFKVIFPAKKVVGIVSFVISVLSMPVLTEDLEIVEATWINSFRKKQYFAMFKVLLFNLFFVQFISTLLIAVTYFDSEYNWIHKAITAGHMRADLSWWQQYFYALYWAIVTMATIGFGDLTPANYLETGVLCILMLVGTTVLSYNISSIGSIVESLKKIGQQREKETIIFKRMCKDEKISMQLQNKILDYIYKAAQFRSEFDFIERKIFLQNLPPELRNDLQQQYAHNIFFKIPFFRALSHETLIKFSSKLKGQIYYPGEDMVITNGRLTKIMLLKHGKIGFMYDKFKSKLNGLILESRSINKNKQHPYLLNKYLLSRIKHLNYRIMSETYSVILELQFEDFHQIIRQNQKDSELYFYLYNSISDIDHQWDICECHQCSPKRHTLFLCPKLHFMPYRSLIIDKYLYSPNILQEADRQYRRHQNRLKRKQALKYWKTFYSEYQKRWQIRSQKRLKNKQIKEENLIVEEQTPQCFLINRQEKYDPPNSKQLSKSQPVQTELILRLNEHILKKQCFCCENTKDKKDKQAEILEIDIMHNYHNFFPKFNPQHLLMKGLRLQKSKQIDDNAND